MTHIIRVNPIIRRLMSDSQRVFLEQEQCILVDINDNAVGTASKYICHHLGESIDLNPNSDPRRLPLHRAFSVFLFSPTHNHKLLLQRRALHKHTFPGLWSNACCSHPLQSDASIQSAMIRKLGHELGIRDPVYGWGLLLFNSSIDITG